MRPAPTQSLALAQLVFAPANSKWATRALPLEGAFRFNRVHLFTLSGSLDSPCSASGTPAGKPRNGVIDFFGWLPFLLGPSWPVFQGGALTHSPPYVLWGGPPASVTVCGHCVALVMRAATTGCRLSLPSSSITVVRRLAIIAHPHRSRHLTFAPLLKLSEIHLGASFFGTHCISGSYSLHRHKEEEMLVFFVCFRSFVS